MISNKVLADTLINDAYSIHYASLTNTDQVKKYTGGQLPTTVIDGKEIFLTFGAIYGAQRKAWANAVLAGPIDLDTTRRIVDCVGKTIEHSIPETMIAIQAKRGEFAAAGLTQIVRNSLDLMLYHHENNASILRDKFSNEDGELLEAFRQEAVNVTKLMNQTLALFS